MLKPIRMPARRLKVRLATGLSDQKDDLGTVRGRLVILGFVGLEGLAIVISPRGLFFRKTSGIIF